MNKLSKFCQIVLNDKALVRGRILAFTQFPSPLLQ